MDIAYGLRIVDVSSPADPVELGAADLESGQVWELEVIGSLLYVVGFTQGSMVLDVSDPGAPTLVGDSLPHGAASMGVALAGNQTCVSTRSSEVEVFTPRWVHVDGIESGDATAWSVIPP